MGNRSVSVWTVLLVLACSTPLWAQQIAGSVVPPGGEPEPPGVLAVTAPERSSYGTEGWTAVVIEPQAFHPTQDGLPYVPVAGGYVSAQAGDTSRYFEAPVSLPSGALVAGYTFMTYDNSASGYVRMFWVKESCPGNAPCHETVLLDVATDSSGTPGYSGPYVSLDVPITWRNTDRSVDPNEIVGSFVRVYFSEGGTGLRVGPLVLWYRRQISPAPQTATFPDVAPDYWAFQYIEALAASGITQGYPDGTFRPKATVTRAQMATFLSRALGLHWGD